VTITVGPQALATRLDTTDTVTAAVRAVPREQFLPDRIWVQETTEGPYEPIDRVTEPERWMRDVYACDHAIVTQFDDGATQWPDRGWRPSCSASQPSVVAGMLDALDVEPGQRVLEIGTGTGYNAALLAELVGPRGHVLSVDVDGELVSAARRNLATAGYQDRVEVLLADGAMTLTTTESVDWVLATAAVQLRMGCPNPPRRDHPRPSARRAGVRPAGPPAGRLRRHRVRARSADAGGIHGTTRPANAGRILVCAALGRSRHRSCPHRHRPVHGTAA
jgi:protein-L-isoaspartate O-methyltransferase